MSSREQSRRATAITEGVTGLGDDLDQVARGRRSVAIVTWLPDTFLVRIWRRPTNMVCLHSDRLTDSPAGSHRRRSLGDRRPSTVGKGRVQCTCRENGTIPMSERRNDRTAEWESLRSTHLRPLGERPGSSARGLHHFALLSSDVEATIAFYQGLLEFPLVELFENRDYAGSTHFFFDVGHDNYLAFFDFPGLELGNYREVLGGLHHLAISVTESQWERLVDKLRSAGIEPMIINGTSAYFPGPDGERLELLSYPLNDMYGITVG
jgi:catechol 2,3-dioxygenase-like lactoylglutathione lyase family enzyme